MLAEMLTKAIRNNVSHEASMDAPESQWPKIDCDTERTMGDATNMTTDPATTDAAATDTATVDTTPPSTEAPADPAMPTAAPSPQSSAPEAMAPAPPPAQPVSPDAAPPAQVQHEIADTLELFRKISEFTQVLKEQPDVVKILHKLLGIKESDGPAA